MATRLQRRGGGYWERRKEEGKDTEAPIEKHILGNHRNVGTVWGQKGSSDALFTPKMDTFKQTILNTAYIKTVEILPSARESLSI